MDLAVSSVAMAAGSGVAGDASSAAATATRGVFNNADMTVGQTLLGTAGEALSASSQYDEAGYRQLMGKVDSGELVARFEMTSSTAAMKQIEGALSSLLTNLTSSNNGLSNLNYGANDGE